MTQAQRDANRTHLALHPFHRTAVSGAAEALTARSKQMLRTFR